ncbi:TolB family protein [Ruania alba]|uniref:Component of the Tol biopolymer transport system n=1 Tax=Ruania alba TaxID=648782 RepID=A0A1H5M8K4_9MICO|nr:PD40 domain-containing protein [Ruania alba]SEE85051.1 component of the Tol biopolymer transport system [Ruania alba]
MGESLTRTDEVTGRQILQLTNSSAHSVHSYYDNPPWCPITSRVTFSRRRPGALDGEICVIDADGGQPVSVASSHAMTPNDGAMPQWSHDGARIYFRDRDEAGALVAWVDVASGERSQHRGDLRMIRPGAHEHAFHTDRRHMSDDAVLRERDSAGVFVQNLETGSTHQLASIEDCVRLHPRRAEIAGWHLYVKHTKWSPDGSRLMFVFTNEKFYDAKFVELPRVKDVYVVDADGQNLRRVGEFGAHPSWHPGGEEIFANSPFGDRPGNSLVLMDTRTGDTRLATTAMGGFGHPSYSPDGTRVVVDHVIASEGTASLNLIHAESGTVEHLVQVAVTDHSHLGTHLHPVWSRDGRQILYASDASGTAQLCVISA